MGILTFVVVGTVAISNSSSDPRRARLSQTPPPSPDLSSRAEPLRRKPHPLPKASELALPRQHFLSLVRLQRPISSPCDTPPQQSAQYSPSQTSSRFRPVFPNCPNQKALH